MAENKGPCWGYKLIDGEVVAKLFEDGNRPRGWKDTPAGLKK
jgi:hypothetical protein